MKYLLFVVLGFVSLQSYAKIGQAGCGLGNNILGSEPGFTQVFAGTTNGTSGNQTFGITSGTSNCDGGGSNAALESFVEANQIALNNDISRGNGETVTALNSLLSCANSEVATKALHNSYQEISTQKSASDMTAKIKKVLRSAPTAGCNEV